MAHGFAEAIEQFIVIEWLVEISDDAGAERVSSRGIVRISRDENDWDGYARCNEALVKLKARHTGQIHVGNYARGRLDLLGTKKIFRAGKGRGSESGRSQETPQRHPKRLVVVDDCNQVLIGHAGLRHRL
jgi:hypothetical protein